MNSSNDQLRSLTDRQGIRSDPGFSLIVAFDYYDGPEKGVALFASGGGVRFSSLGESRSRLFRAFEFTAIEGDWRPYARALLDVETGSSDGLVLVPSSASELLTRFEKLIFEANASGYYVGIGSPNLEWLRISIASQDEIETLRRPEKASVGFYSVHQILKGRK